MSSRELETESRDREPMRREGGSSRRGERDGREDNGGREGEREAGGGGRDGADRVRSRQDKLDLEWILEMINESSRMTVRETHLQCNNLVKFSIRNRNVKWNLCERKHRHLFQGQDVASPSFSWHLTYIWAAREIR